MLGAIEMPSTKPRRAPVKKPTAVPRTETERISHPRLEGHVEIVQRVVDTIEAMRKRKQLSEQEYRAAEKYRMAWATLHGSVGGIMDYERARGGSLPGQMPAQPYMLASEVCRNFRTFLYPKDYAVVHRICALGMTVEQAAASLYQENPTRAQKEDCGRRLREGLTQYSEQCGEKEQGREGKIRHYRSEKVGTTNAETVPQGKAVHATADKVYRSGR